MSSSLLGEPRLWCWLLGSTCYCLEAHVLSCVCCVRVIESLGASEKEKFVPLLLKIIFYKINSHSVMRVYARNLVGGAWGLCEVPSKPKHLQSIISSNCLFSRLWLRCWWAPLKDKIGKTEKMKNKCILPILQNRRFHLKMRKSSRSMISNLQVVFPFSKVCYSWAGFAKFIYS